MRRLHLLRHAKSSWDQPSLDDHERPLNRRGRRAAASLRRYLLEQDIRPSLVLCSSAARAVETLERIACAVGPQTPVSIEPDLYHASSPYLLATVLALDDRMRSAMLIGHNPGMHDLALTLAQPGAEYARIASKLPTGALVTLEFDVARWCQVAAGQGLVTDYVVPRELP